MKKHVKITTSNKCDFILQMSLEWTNNNQLFLSQNRQIEKLIEKYNLKDSKQTFKTPMEAKLNLIGGSKDNLPDVPYAQLVCALLFIARCTRPDILFPVTLLYRYLTAKRQGGATVAVLRRHCAVFRGARQEVIYSEHHDKSVPVLGFWRVG
jgi:hypothetical protein